MGEGERGRVLVVDDDPGVLETTVALLSDGFDVVGMPSPRRALRQLERSRFDVLCSDYEMPEMNGLELFRAATELHPALRKILITGLREYEHAAGEHRVLIKPYDPDRLVQTVEHEYRLSTMRRAVRKSREVSFGFSSATHAKEPEE